MKLAYSTAMAALCLGLLAQPQTALAEVHQAHSEGLSAQLAALATGDQLVIDNASGEVRFGGHAVRLDGFSGVAGYGSEIAYLIAIDGQAAVGDPALDGLTANAGSMLLIPPFGQEPSVQRFDARRLHDALAQNPGVSGLASIAMLDGLAKGQDRAVFLGRLGRTSFNVATLGSAEAEMGRRERVGGTHVRNARFTGDAGVETLEQRIVARFLASLAAGDAAAVAELLDPLPYGIGSMANGGGEARLAMARSLIAQRDWSAFADAAPQQVEETLWRAGAALVGLRRTTEFAFIETIEVGS